MVSKKEYLEYAGKLVEKSITGNRKLLSVWSKVGLILLIILGGIITIRSVAVMLIIRRINRNFVIGVSLIVISIILLVKRSKMLKLYRGEIREKLIAYLLKDNSYYFDKSGWISSYEFENSQFSRKYDCFSSCGLPSLVSICDYYKTFRFHYARKFLLIFNVKIIRIILIRFNIILIINQTIRF